MIVISSTFMQIFIEIFPRFTPPPPSDLLWSRVCYSGADWGPELGNCVPRRGELPGMIWIYYIILSSVQLIELIAEFDGRRIVLGTSFQTLYLQIVSINFLKN